MNEFVVLIVGAILGLVFGYVVQFTSNPIQKRFEELKAEITKKRASKSAAKAKQRIAELESELAELEIIANNPIRVQFLMYTNLKSWAKLIITLIFMTFLFQFIYDFLIPTDSYKIIINIGFAILVVSLVFYFSIPLKGFPELHHFFNLEKYKKDLENQIAELLVVIDNFDKTTTKTD